MWDFRSTGAPDRGFGSGVHSPARIIANIGHTRAHYGTAMYPFQLPRLGQFGQIAADGLQGHAKARGKVFYHHPPLGARQFQNLLLSEVQRQGRAPFRTF